MDPRKQKWLVSALAGTAVTLLGRPLSDRFLSEVPPERRKVVDDFKEALLKASVSVVATVIASIIVRRLAGNR